MSGPITDAVWCGCGLEAYIHLRDEMLCSFCYLSRLKDAVRDTLGEDLDCMATLDRSEAVLRMRRAEEDLRLVVAVHGKGAA